MIEHSRMYVIFLYASVLIALFMMGLSIWLIDEPLATKGYLAMGVLFLTGSLISLTKTLRDIAESEKHITRLDRAKTEKLLSEYSEVEP